MLVDTYSAISLVPAGDGRAVASEGKHNGSQEVMTLVVVFVFANDLVEGRWCMWRLCWLW